MYKPETHNAVSPYLLVGDAEAALAFIEAVFGAKPGFIHRQTDDTIGHAEVRIDDTVVMLGQMPGGPEAHVHVYVPDVDATFAKAKAAGAEIVQEPMEKGDGDRRGGVKDSSGTTWWLSTMVDASGRSGS